MRTPYRIKFFNWFQLHINGVLNIYASTDQICNTLIRKKIGGYKNMILRKDDNLTFFYEKHDEFFFLSNVLKNGSVDAFITISTTNLQNFIAL